MDALRPRRVLWFVSVGEFKSLEKFVSIFPNVRIEWIVGGKRRLTIASPPSSMGVVIHHFHQAESILAIIRRALFMR